MKINKDKSDNLRLTVSFGLVALYVAVIKLVPFNVFQLNFNEQFFLTFQKTFLMIWGIASILLIIYIFLFSLSLKYIKPDSVDIMGYNIKIAPKFYKATFDTGIEYYSVGVFTNVISFMPMYLSKNGVNVWLSLTIWLLIVVLLSFALLRIEMKQTIKK